MITIQNIHLNNKEEGIKSKPLKFQYKGKDQYTKLTTEIDDKECFLSIVGQKGIIPELIQDTKNMKNYNKKMDIYSASYKLDLDINLKNILVLRKRSCKIFDDNALLVKFRVPNENFTIKIIKKYTDLTNIRYMKKSKDKKEVLIYLTYKSVLRVPAVKLTKDITADNIKFENIKSQFISNKLDGVLKIIMEDKTTGKHYVEHITPYVHFNNVSFDNDDREIDTLSLSILSTSIDNTILIPKGYPLLLKQNWLRDDMFNVVELSDVSKIKGIKFDTKDSSVVHEIYTIGFCDQTLEIIKSRLLHLAKAITNFKFRLIDVSEKSRLLSDQFDLRLKTFRQDERLKDESKLKFTYANDAKENLVEYKISEQDKHMISLKERKENRKKGNCRENKSINMKCDCNCKGGDLDINALASKIVNSCCIDTTITNNNNNMNINVSNNTMKQFCK